MFLAPSSHIEECANESEGNDVHRDATPAPIGAAFEFEEGVGEREGEGLEVLLAAAEVESVEEVVVAVEEAMEEVAVTPMVVMVEGFPKKFHLM